MLIFIIAALAIALVCSLARMETMHSEALSDQNYIEYMKRMIDQVCRERDELSERLERQLEELADLRAQMEGDSND